MIEILLWQDVPKLGKRESVVKVSDGYARNYLFPHKLATMATKENLKQLENYKKRALREEEKVKLTFQQLAGEIEKTSCTLEVKANEEGILYGSVTPQMITDALHKQGWKQIKAEMVELETPVKELGVYRAKVKLHQEIVANCRLWVVEESITEKPPEETK